MGMAHPSQVLHDQLVQPLLVGLPKQIAVTLQLAPQRSRHDLTCGRVRAGTDVEESWAMH